VTTGVVVPRVELRAYRYDGDPLTHVQVEVENFGTAVLIRPEVRLDESYSRSWVGIDNMPDRLWVHVWDALDEHEERFGQINDIPQRVKDVRVP
jgi:hypothetical protein